MNEEMVRRELVNALAGRYAHPDPEDVLAGIDAATAGRRPAGAPHGIAEELGHIVYWLEVSVDWLSGIEPDEPSPDAAWPVPAGAIAEPDWDDLRRRYAEGIARVRAIAAEEDLAVELPGVPDVPRLNAILVQAAHQSWHLGQIVLLRKFLEAEDRSAG